MMKNLGMLNSRYVPFILIGLSILICFFSFMDTYLNDLEQGQIYPSDVASYIQIVIQNFCITQFSFMVLGGLGYLIFRKKTGSQKPYVIYPMPQSLIRFNLIFTGLLLLIMNIDHAGSTAYSHMSWDEYLIQPEIWILAYFWFATIYILLFYSEIVIIWFVKQIRKII